ncbi:MAG: SMP-30/gluconolactonase/LRE family protein [Deltaproteobacteria bacterium]|nr:SMP-30/gluconolactonase/LRE family protein [Deltaproteobacteria bacterium]
MKRQLKYHVKRAHGLTISLVVILLLLPAFALGADSTMKIYSKLPGAPEGLCLDSRGNLYASMPSLDEVVLLKRDGSYKHVAWVPSKEDVGKGEIFGMEVDKDDNIIIAYVEFSKYISLGDDLMNPRHPACGDVNVKKSGVYKIDAKTRKVTAVATRGDGWPFCFPDDVALDSDGNIYLTDLTYSGVWKISPDGKKVTMWSDDPLLNWSEPSLPMGANPIVIDQQNKNIYVATTTMDGRIVRIPIKEDGSAGKAELISRGHTYFDGMEIDDEGYIYAAESSTSINQIIVLPPNTIGWLGMTPRKVIGVGDPLQGPTSIVIRDGVLYTANLAFGLPEEKKNKAVVAIENFSEK